jgi:benzoate-CoA ligase family protein
MKGSLYWICPGYESASRGFIVWRIFDRYEVTSLKSTGVLSALCLITELAYNAALMTIQKDPFNLLDYFLGDEKLESIGTHLAIEFRGLKLSYNELRQIVDSCRESLLSLGVKAGDRIALLLYDSPEFVAYFLATTSLGAICVPVNTFLSAEEINFILSDSGSTVLIAEDDLAKKIFKTESDNEKEKWTSILEVGEYKEKEKDGVREGMRLIGLFPVPPKQESSLPQLPLNQGFYNKSGSITPEGIAGEKHSLPQEVRSKETAKSESFSSVKETPALLLYTSGSTGTPKGALHSQGNVVATIEGFGSDILRLQSGDSVFSASRLFFAYGLGNSLSFPLAAGARVILENRRPTPQMISNIFAEQKPTVFFGVPAVYRALLDFHESVERLDTSSLRMCVSAGEALPAAIFEEWQQTFGMTILDGIGSTEMLHMFMSNRVDAAKAGSSGNLVCGYEAEILDDGGNKTGIGEQGNLWIKGASTMLGYWQRDDLTAAVMRDEWMRTGDVYRQDKEGYYYHIGRSDDCFKVKGLWVSPIEIESVLLTHPEVVEAAVVASTDENGLATAKAYLVIRQGSETLTKELYEYVSARLTMYKTPTQYEFVKEMPRTSTGKIQRFKLRV